MIPNCKEDIKDIEDIDDIVEFEKIGFYRASLRLLAYIRKHEILVRIFNNARSKGSNRSFGSGKIFGDYRKYYYKIDHKDEFVEFLVKKFYENNPDPAPGLKMAFSRMLHQNRLHWKGCTCTNKNGQWEDYKFKRKK